jgi:hypothetical protein
VSTPTINPRDPFAQLVDPQALSQAVARSGLLDGLQRRVFRPLDKPLIALRSAPGARPALR